MKNPVGKYLDPKLVKTREKKEVIQFALQTGLLQDIIDIFDDKAIKNQAQKFLNAYKPGRNWECIASDSAIPWSYYWQAIFKKNILKSI